MTNRYRSQFPIFNKYPELAYLDNAATTQRPRSLIQAMTQFYTEQNANIHRGVYDLSNQSSIAFEECRNKVAVFMNVKPENIAFTSGTTESINIIASSYLSNKLERGDNILVSILEHHSNFIPWQQLAKEKEAEFRVVPIDSDGDLDLIKLDGLLDDRTKILAITHVSNTLGTVNDLIKIVDIAHKKGISVVVDAAQSAAFYDLDQKKIGYDFLAFSGHKMFGPFGIGVLFASDEFKDQFIPYGFGGGMIQEVTINETRFAKYPQIIEAGTPNVSGVIGMSTALDFLSELNREECRNSISDLGEYCREQLTKIDKVIVYGQPKKRSGIVLFNVQGIHPHDVASFLNKDRIAVRAGMHCVQPLMQELGVASTLRASFSIYNTQEEIDRLRQSLEELIKFWS